MDNPLLVWLVVVAWLVGAYMFEKDGREAGRIEVASGQYTCQLVETPDKTTDWECLKVEKPHD